MAEFWPRAGEILSQSRPPTLQHRRNFLDKNLDTLDQEHNAQNAQKSNGKPEKENDSKKGLDKFDSLVYTPDSSSNEYETGFMVDG
jgi:hypothetical protein